MKIITLEEIKSVLPEFDVLPEMEKGFQSYSEGRVVVPPIGEMILDKGEVHIKYGYIKEDEYYVIKIASGFYHNPEIGLPSSNGLMLLFRQDTGELEGILLDEGYLTNIRTAMAGAIAARYLAPKYVTRIGIVGAGTQARFQLSYLKNIISCRDVLVWGMNTGKLNIYKSDMEHEGFNVKTTLDIQQVIRHCNLIVCTTPSKIPLVKFNEHLKGTHITAMGSDTREKQELDPMILRNADVIVADSIKQCLERGEIFKAIEAGMISKDVPIELGQIISGTKKGRSSEDQITVADLTGLAVQDIIIAVAVFKALILKNPPMAI